MSNSQVYESWLAQQPQYGLNQELFDTSNNIDQTFLSTRVGRYAPLLNDSVKITTLYNTLNTDGDLILSNTLELSSNLINAAKGDKMRVLLMQVLHMISKTSAPAVTNTDGNMKFSIEANGDVRAIGTDANGKTVTLATAYAHTTINSEHFNMCNRHTDLSDACIVHLSFIAGVHNGNYTNVDTGALERFLDADVGNTGTDKNVAKVVNSFAILRRIKWRAKSDDSAVYRFEDFSKEERADADVRAMLKFMLDQARSFDAEVVKEQDAWNTFVGTNNNYSDLGKLVKKCVENVNREPQILKAQIGHQRFSKSNASGRSVAGRMDALKARPSYFDPITQHIRSQSANRVPTIILSGGSNSANSTNMLRNALDDAMANLERNGKRLASATYQKFQNKLSILEQTELEINQFLGELNNYGNTNDAKEAPGHSVSEERIKKFQQDSKKAADTTWVLQSGIANLGIKLRQVAPAAPQPTSYSL